MIITNVVMVVQLVMLGILSFMFNSFDVSATVFFWVMFPVMWMMSLEKDYLLEEYPHLKQRLFTREMIRTSCFALYSTMCGLLVMGRIFNNYDLYQFGLLWALFAVCAQLICDSYYGRTFVQAPPQRL